MFLDDLLNGSRKQLAAPFADVRRVRPRLGLSTDEVKVPVRWWHGDRDHIIPFSHGRHRRSVAGRRALSPARRKPPRRFGSWRASSAHCSRSGIGPEQSSRRRRGSLSLAFASAPPAVAQPDPLDQMPKGFVALSDVAPTILHDMRYFSPHNFVGSRIDGYDSPTCVLTCRCGCARPHNRISPRSGYTLKVYGCYRPQRAVDEFVGWADDLGDDSMKAEFYPRVDKSALFADGYIAEQSGHSRGSTVDLTLVKVPAASTASYIPGEPLVDCTASQEDRFRDNSIDMGTGYDCFDTLAHADPHRRRSTQNRLFLLEGMQRQGFVNYDKEWWHSFKPEPFPDTCRLPHRLAAQLARDLGELSLAELFDQVDRYRVIGGALEFDRGRGASLSEVSTPHGPPVRRGSGGQLTVGADGWLRLRTALPADQRTRSRRSTIR